MARMVFANFMMISNKVAIHDKPGKSLVCQSNEHQGFYLALTGGGTAPLHLFCAVGAVHVSCSGNIGACRHLYNCVRPEVILTIFFCLLPMAGNKMKRAHVYRRNKETGRDAVAR